MTTEVISDRCDAMYQELIDEGADPVILNGILLGGAMRFFRCEYGMSKAQFLDMVSMHWDQQADRDKRN